MEGEREGGTTRCCAPAAVIFNFSLDFYELCQKKKV